MARAISDLPVPLSPVISTVAFVSATASIMSKIFNMRWSCPMMFSMPNRRSSWAFRVSVFLDDLLLVESPLNGHEQLFVDQRLGQEVEGPEPNGVDGGFHGAIAGDHDDRRGGTNPCGNGSADRSRRRPPDECRPARDRTASDRRPPGLRRGSTRHRRHSLDREASRPSRPVDGGRRRPAAAYRVVS